MRQVGNAVPVLLAKIAAKAIRDHLIGAAAENGRRDNIIPFKPNDAVRKAG
jgi:hypothetical protein